MSISEKDFDALLRARRFEPPSPMLAQRIIVAARQSQQKSSGLILWLQSLFADVMLPKPAYALATILSLGIGIGLATTESSLQDDRQFSLQSIIANDGDTL